MNLKRLFGLGLVGLSLLSGSAFSADYQSGNYPRFSYAKLFSTGETVNEKPNIVLAAIENGDAIPLKYDQAFLSAKNYLFPQKFYTDSYTVDRVANRQFVNAIASLVKEFACAEYRFRRRLPESDQCAGHVFDQNKKEHMPFVSGRYLDSRMEQNADDKASRVSFYAYLPSGNETSLESAFGSVHELGTFFGRFAHRQSLILSVNIQAYWLDSDLFRKEKINESPLTYFIVLPKAIDISKQGSERAAAEFAVNNAQILILGR
ncbi:hypothetical protein [Vibrio sp. HN007]|uniref:hypothetical protein n=1 Tax=Vibrio iocasae TaxID=3098914 RepID=UPI0035D4E2AB